MSFILDALKKSETDRQRQSGPALYEMRVARPSRMALPPWAVAIVALLGVNLVVISWMLLHRSAAPAAAPAPASPPAAAAPVPGAPPPGYYAQAPQAPGQYYPYPPPQPGQAGQPMPPQGMAPQPGMAPPVPVQGQQPYPPQGGAYYAQAPGGYSAPQPAVPPPGGATVQASNGVNGGGAVTEESGNADDDAPAVPAQGASGSQVRRGSETGLPFYPDPDAATEAGLPKLRMDFHSYGANPQQRMVMINSHNLREGQVSPDGVRVDEITPDGAAISKGPARYFLPRQ